MSDVRKAACASAVKVDMERSATEVQEREDAVDVSLDNLVVHLWLLFSLKSSPLVWS